MTVAILYREEMKEMDYGPCHPLHGDRYEDFIKLFKKRLKENGYYRFEAAEPATDADLLRICTQARKDCPCVPERF